MQLLQSEGRGVWIRPPPVASLRFATGGYSHTILNRIEETAELRQSAISSVKVLPLARLCAICDYLKKYIEGNGYLTL